MVSAVIAMVAMVSAYHPSAKREVVLKIVGELSSPQCQRYDPLLILSMVSVESSFRAKVESPTGDIGVGQLSPLALQELRITKLDRSSVLPLCTYLGMKRTWTQYHSKTPSKAKVYRAKVTRVMESFRKSMLKYQSARAGFNLTHNLSSSHNTTLAGVGFAFVMPVLVVRRKKWVSFKRKDIGV